MKSLIKKYDVPVPRYTSYPTVPAWKTDTFSLEKWESKIKEKRADIDEDGLALYIHLPYCEKLCTYCGCNKRITVNHDVELPYIMSVIKEWYLYLEKLGKRPTIREIHLGGGTPTFFTPDHLKLLIDSIVETSNLHPKYDFSFEGHPNNTTYDHLKTLYEVGFKRVSFGIQDFDPVVQKAINRLQPAENVEQVTRWAREIGYESVNYDLIYGLPFQNILGIRKTMDFVAAYKPDRIAFYSYAHVPWTSPGQRAYSEEHLPTGSQKRALNELGQKLLKHLGYVSIGMDHFALPNDEMTKAALDGTLKRNFMGYTVSNTKAMLGLGVSSISDLGFGYAQNVKSVEGYMDKVKQGLIPVFKGHFNTEREILTREKIMEIACTRKIPMVTVTSLKAEAAKSFEEMLEEGLVERECVGFSITEKGTQFLRNICALFDEYYSPNKTEGVFSKAV
jgi:oxygen-independent coproporphyrinogen III oxidase